MSWKNPGKVRARTYGTKSPSRSEALRFIDSAKSPSTKIDGSLVNFRRRLSNRHERPRRMLTMDIRRTPIGLWARLRDSHKSGPQSGWSSAWTLAQRNDWSGIRHLNLSSSSDVLLCRTQANSSHFNHSAEPAFRPSSIRTEDPTCANHVDVLTVRSVFFECPLSTSSVVSRVDWKACA